MRCITSTCIYSFISQTSLKSTYRSRWLAGSHCKTSWTGRPCLSGPWTSSLASSLDTITTASSSWPGREHEPIPCHALEKQKAESLSRSTEAGCQRRFQTRNHVSTVIRIAELQEDRHELSHHLVRARLRMVLSSLLAVTTEMTLFDGKRHLTSRQNMLKHVISQLFKQ